MNLPASISVSGASLPQIYQEAQAALSQCSQVDECKDWADKAAALASYARQSENQELERMAQRIRARAIRRTGELLKQIEPAKPGPKSQLEAHKGHQLGRSDAARDAGMSPKQAKTATRVASIPKKDFEQQVDGDAAPLTDKQQQDIDATLERLSREEITRQESNYIIAEIDPDWNIRNGPPTLSQLAAQGTKKRENIVDLQGRDPGEFNRAMHYVGAFERVAKELLGQPHDQVIPTLNDKERQRLRAAIKQIDAIADKTITRI